MRLKDKSKSKISDAQQRVNTAQEELDKTKRDASAAVDERNKAMRQLGELEDTAKQLRDELGACVADRERYFNERLQLSQQLQQESYQRELAKRERWGLQLSISSLSL